MLSCGIIKNLEGGVPLLFSIIGMGENLSKIIGRGGGVKVFRVTLSPFLNMEHHFGDSVISLHTHIREVIGDPLRVCSGSVFIS